MGNGINASDGNNFLFRTGLTPSKPSETTTPATSEQGSDYITGLNGINGEKDTSKLSWAQLMGVSIAPGEQADAAFDADDLAMLEALAGVDTSSANPVTGILAMEEADFDIMELEEISPNDEVTARVIDNYSTGAASRIESGMAAIDEIADGNPEIADMAALMFHVAAYDREQA